jgi:hypothetical protein
MAKKMAEHLSCDTKRFFIDGFGNERDGCVLPATLESALESLRQGYEPFEGFNAKRVEREILQLIKEEGCDTEVSVFLENGDRSTKKEGLKRRI